MNRLVRGDAGRHECPHVWNHCTPWAAHYERKTPADGDGVKAITNWSNRVKQRVERWFRR